MLRVLAVIGVCAIAFVVTLIAWFAFLAVDAVDTVEEGEEYARYVLETYGKNWDPAFIREQQARELAAQNPDYEGLAVAFTQTFGTIERLDSFECPAFQQLQEGARITFVLACRSSARSTRGQIDVEVQVVKREEWKTNVVFVHGFVPRQDDPFSQSVNSGVNLASAGIGQPMVGCNEGIRFSLAGMSRSSGCLRKSESHSAH